MKRILWLAFVLTASVSAAEWKVGLAAVRITPEQPVMLAGYAARNRPFDVVEDDLFAKAMVIEDAGGERGVIVTTDLIGIAAEIGEPICARLQERAGLRREQIVLNASHTHTGPTLSATDTPRPGTNAEYTKATADYTRRLQNRIVDLVMQAIADLKPANLSWGIGVAHFAMNRREFTAKGVRLGVNPRGLVDRSVPVLRIDGADGKPRAVLFGYACHNTTLSQTDYMVSPDYAGYAQRFVQEKLGGTQAMFVSGLGAAANPYPRGSIPIAREHGAALGQEVCRVVETKLTPITGPLRCVFGQVELPVRQTPRSELEKLAASGNVREKASATQMLQALDRGEPQLKHYAAPLAVWQFGHDLTWVALSGEVVADYVPLIEKAIGPLQLWLSSYSNDYFGYVPTARLLEEGGYETLGLFRANGIFTPDVETVLVNKVRELTQQAGRKLPTGP
jgi:neutral ceramidase